MFASCDSSFVPDIGSPEEESKRIQTVRQWYAVALEEDQRSIPSLPNGLYKVGNDSTIAAILAAMVQQHSPDWDQIETWDNTAGGYVVATLLEGTATSPNHSGLSVVRTLVVDIDGQGRKISGQLVEFIALGLDASLFRDYVVQWLSGDFGNNRMMVAEYTIEYESIKTTVYAPGQDPRETTMTLTQKPISGKSDNTIFCWVSDIDFSYICRVGHDYIYGDSCLPFIARLELTCASFSTEIIPGVGSGDNDGSDDEGNGNDGDGSNDGQGGGSDGDGNPDVSDNEIDECLCTDQKICDLIAEYDEFRVGYTPDCIQFMTGGSTRNFSWNEFMGNWGSGTESGKHNPYGIMQANVMNQVQQLRNLDGRPIVLTSGYRCPKGNSAVGGVSNSYHMRGRAVDIRTSCDRTYYDKLYDFAITLGLHPTKWGTYTDCHLHIEM